MRKIAITTGEPAGIGPEISVAAAVETVLDNHTDFKLILIGDLTLLKSRAQAIGISCNFHRLVNASDELNLKAINVLDIPLKAECIAGKLSTQNAQYVIDTLNAAFLGVENNQFNAIATAPVQKSIINEAGIVFSGHTEFFQQMASADKVVMMLMTANLKVALATTHLPLSQVSDAINAKELVRTIEIIHHSLCELSEITHPNIAVCGLNPHAGEQGVLGTEELDHIIPAIKESQLAGINVSGPFPADTIFVPEHCESFDLVLAMYHDQGLPVLKAQGFGEAVNITLGLPFVRTSVDHGTALDLAGQGKANCQSMIAAIHAAADMVQI